MARRSNTAPRRGQRLAALALRLKVNAWQVSMPEVDKPSVRQVIEAEAVKPLRGGSAAAGGLFDTNARAQMDMLDAVK